jgi:hypothetical protein
VSIEHVYLPIPCDFSVEAVNRMLQLGQEHDLGEPERVDYYSQWD